MTRQLLISKNTLPLYISLSNYLYHFFKADKFAFIEDISDINNSVFVMEYQDFLLNISHHDNFIKLSKNNNYILIRHVFGVDVDTITNAICNLITNYNINPQNIFIQFAYYSDKTKLEKTLENQSINGVRIFVYEYYMDIIYQKFKAGFINCDITNIKTKFSVFSRRFDTDRFLLYLELLKRNLLKDFCYTFSNCHAETRPYPYTDIEIPEVIKIAQNYGYTDEHIIDWINKLPYADLKDFTDPFSNFVNKSLGESNIHVVLETAISYNPVGIVITEKMYKPIILKKSFYIFGPYKASILLREEGFKTFSPFLNEDYLTISENNYLGNYPREKINKICDDIERINNLNTSEFLNLISQLDYIAEHNFNHFLNIADAKQKELTELLKHLELV